MLIRKKQNKKSFTGRIFSFKYFVLAGFLAAVFLGSSLAKEYYRGYKIEEEINSLKKEIDVLEKNNYNFSRLVEYYNTDEYRELEARRKLNLKKEGEEVVFIKPPLENAENAIEEEKGNNENNLPNYKKWWNYFFASRG